MEFAGFLGNTDLKQRLSAAFHTGRVSHSYLLCGPAGAGKKTLASQLAAALECTSDEPFCGRCGQCRKALSGIHPDVISVDDPEKKTVSVDLIRKLQADAYIRPNEGRRKVYLIPRAQDLSDSAQNALLKLIEEPPSYAVFLLLTDNSQKLLPTVRSRCVELRLEPVSRQEALPWLRERFPQESPDDHLAAYLRSGGYLGQAAELLQGALHLPQTTQFVQAYGAADRFAMAQLLTSMERLPRDKILEILSQWKRLLTDALLSRSGIPSGSDASALSRSRTAPQLAAAAQVIQTALDHCTANVGIGHLCGWLATALL